MKIIPKILGCLSVVVLLVTDNAAATCSTDIASSTQDFTLHDDGTVTHKPTGLMWMRCSLGQSWDGSFCTGISLSYSWINALAAAQSHSFAGHSDWRLPNKNELASLIERRCSDPAINSVVFPNTPSTWSWSSSPYAADPNGAWGVVFLHGYVTGATKNNPFVVRLVRAGL